MDDVRYFIVARADLTDELMVKCYTKNPYELQANIANTKVVFPCFLHDIPTEFFVSDDAAYTDTEIEVYLADPANGFVPGAPIDIAITAFSIIESASIGDAIGTLSTTDSEDGTHTYSITTDADSKFQIDGTTLEVGGSLDYNTAISHDVTIRVTNNTTELYHEETFTIDVTSAWAYSAGYQTDGITTYLENTSMEVFDGESALTIGVLIDFDASGNDYEYHFSKVGISPLMLATFRYNDRLYFRVGGGGVYVSHGCTASSGTYLFTYVYDGSEAVDDRLKIYKNDTLLTGTKEADTPATIPAGVDALTAYAGAERKTTNFANTKFMDMFVVDGALTATEITNLYNSGEYQDVDTVTDKTVTAHWTFGESDNDTTTLVEDIAGSYDLAAYNFTSGDIS